MAPRRLAAPSPPFEAPLGVNMDRTETEADEEGICSPRDLPPRTGRGLAFGFWREDELDANALRFVMTDLNTRLRGRAVLWSRTRVAKPFEEGEEVGSAPTPPPLQSRESTGRARLLKLPPRPPIPRQRLRSRTRARSRRGRGGERSYPGWSDRRHGRGDAGNGMDGTGREARGGARVKRAERGRRARAGPRRQQRGWRSGPASEEERVMPSTWLRSPRRRPCFLR